MKSMEKMKDEALSILIREPNGKFRLDEKALDRVLGDSDDLAVVISVAGPFRKGKSFLLDYFIRYLETESNDLGDENKPLQGFSWRGGSERDTTGLLCWSKIYQVHLFDGRSARLILLDTQGAFDSHSTVQESAVVFALSTLISSVQIYNLSQNIQEDDLHHLQLFAEYGRVASCQTSSFPFQRLIFLVRDWSYPYEADYGWKGGKKIISRRLTISEGQHPELREIRKHISSSFSDIRAFLMPHPGYKAATEKEFDGRLSDLSPPFRSNLNDFIRETLSSDNLLVKKINDQELKVKDLRHYFKSYIDVFSGDTIPEPKSILSATAEANHLAAVASGKDSYGKSMKEVIKSYLDPKKLEVEHDTIKSKVIQQFKNKPKMGSKELSEVYRIELEHSIDQMYLNFKELNQAKCAFVLYVTPALLLGSATLFYLLSGVLAFIGLYTISNWFNILAGTFIIGLGTWAYIKWTGEFQHIGNWIDSTVNFLYHRIVLPSYQTFATAAS